MTVETIKNELAQHLSAFAKLEVKHLEQINRIAELFVAVLKADQKILVAGNGGSAADAQHFAAELVGRYLKERRGLPVISLSTDTSALTAIGNDYGFQRVFSRQVEALGKPGDLLIVISTSGNSLNLIEAAKSARELGLQVVGLLGKDGGSLKALVDEALVAPSDATPRIQEIHEWIWHTWCALIDAHF